LTCTGLLEVRVIRVDTSLMSEQYVPLLVTFVLTGGLVGSMLLLNRLLGPSRPSVVKGEAFECGNPSSGSAWGRFSVKFYMTALSFIVFDVEVVFFYPWAVTFRQLGWFGFSAMMLFVALLAVALLYEWRKGALEWD
jgi:NADH-quinone oxidoreductase subunit A